MSWQTSQDSLNNLLTWLTGPESNPALKPDFFGWKEGPDKTFKQKSPTVQSVEQDTEMIYRLIRQGIKVYYVSQYHRTIIEITDRIESIFTFFPLEMEEKIRRAIEAT